MRITRADVPKFHFREYVKVASTPLSDEILQPDTEVETLEGLYVCSEPSRLAKDVNGNVYPVAASVFEKSFREPGAWQEEVEEALRLWREWYASGPADAALEAPPTPVRVALHRAAGLLEVGRARAHSRDRPGANVAKAARAAEGNAGD